jgi:hypothetical protein
LTLLLSDVGRYSRRSWASRSGIFYEIMGFIFRIHDPESAGQEKQYTTKMESVHGLA